MIATETSALVKSIAAALVAEAPHGWTSIVAYYEAFGDDGVGQPSFVSRAEFTPGGKVRRDFRTSSSVYLAVEALYFAYAKSAEEVWSGFAIKVLATGSYTTRFYYGPTPLADGDHEETEKRIASVSAYYAA